MRLSSRDLVQTGNGSIARPRLASRSRPAGQLCREGRLARRRNPRRASPSVSQDPCNSGHITPNVSACIQRVNFRSGRFARGGATPRMRVMMGARAADFASVTMELRHSGAVTMELWHSGAVTEWDRPPYPLGGELVRQRTPRPLWLVCEAIGLLHCAT